MEDVASESRKPADPPVFTPTQRSAVVRPRRRLPLVEGSFRGARVMGWVALSSLVAAIFLAIVMAIAQGKTAPLMITWLSALVMTAVSGIIAAVLVVRRTRSKAVALDPGSEAEEMASDEF